MQEVSLAEMRAGCAGTALATFSTTTASSGEVIKTKAVAAASLINERVPFLWGAARFREFFVNSLLLIFSSSVSSVFSTFGTAALTAVPP
ncbi:hypothetical protein N5J23_07160 [Comamonas aquatica]|uniref:Uncharacterized protein n=1 Tax=Comamonas aquatica TaxID=225991 RepID=A0AA42HWA4_9BURK|nr:hypothetical protein [Comamonas aquatica]MDH0364131.1 hypothetical protein [Comamonas aquatica]MDH1429752.1 hypothetical protein [Comamonas aquatica]MDH1605352.1 hypothetical protein [Comamonas aquatica]MDH1616899.1 hypothetical protein [Comamonas aquatica]MDH1767137.1 hypothetical protein [Comamonas aquatica]